MAKVSKSELAGRLFEYLRRVEETREPLVVTDDDEPVLRIEPIRQRLSAAVVFGNLRGRVVYHEDWFAPTSDEYPAS